MTGTGEAAPVPPLLDSPHDNSNDDDASHPPARTGNYRANALADRLEQGARALMTFASGLTDAEWQTRIPKDGRTIGVIVHHVASVYPLEIQLAQTLAAGQTGDGRDD